MDRKDKTITSISKKEREEAWDDVFAKEEGIIIEFDNNTNACKARFMEDGATRVAGWLRDLFCGIRPPKAISRH